MQSSHPLLVRPITPTLLALAAPNVVAMLAQSLVAIAETAYAGNLGVAPLAGLALAFPLVMLQQMMSAGAMGGGISSAISRALGAGDGARARALALHATVIGFIAGVGIMLLMLSLGPSIYTALGGRGAALEQAMLYSNIVFLGAVPTWMTNTLASVLRGTGNMRAPSLVLLGAAIGQVILSGILALGIGPVPRLGMAGLAAGQVIAMTGAAVALAILLGSGRSTLTLSPRGFVPDRALFRDILKVGAIAVISPIQSVATVLVATALVARAGTEALAGYGIGARLEFLLVPIVFAIGVAAVPMVGMAIGAGQTARARRVAWTAGIIAAAVTGVIGVVAAVAPDLWATLYTREAAVLAEARAYLSVAGIAYPCFGFGLALYFASQGSGQIIGPVLAQSARLAVVVIGAGLVLRTNASAEAVYMVIALAFVVYGLASALALHLARWGEARS